MSIKRARSVIQCRPEISKDPWQSKVKTAQDLETVQKTCGEVIPNNSTESTLISNKQL